MRTSTSIGSLVYGLFGRILRSSRAPSREKLCKPLGYGLWDALVHPSSERRDLLHAARRDEADRRARHHVDGLDLGREGAIELVHLELPLEVGDHSKALHDHLRVPLAGEVHDELGEDGDLDVAEVSERLVQERDPFVEREHRRLVVGIADDADDDTVEDPRRARDHVDVTQHHGVVAAGTDRRDHWCSKIVTRVDPYLRLVRTARPASCGSAFAADSSTTRPSSARTWGR